MTKTLLLSLFYLSSFLLLGVSKAEACSCMSMTSCEAYARSKIVFTGKVLKAASDQGSRKHQVQIEENFLGMENQSLVDVFTDQATSCAFALEEGKDYLIFAWKSEENGAVWTGMCSHTEQLEYAKDDLEYLRSVKATNKSGSTIQGVVLETETSADKPRKPEQIDRVFIENTDGQKYEANVESNGKYQLSGLSAGKYQIFLKPPKGFITGDEASVYADDENMNPKFLEIAGHGCTIKNFEIKINGVISGKITDADGLPVKDLSVNLLRLTDPNEIKKSVETTERLVEPDAEPEEDSEESANETTSEMIKKIDEPEAKEYEADYDAYTDENGFYIFKGLPPGRYLLGVSVDDYLNIDSDEDQYLPTYFPGSKKKEAAIVIELKKAETLSDRNIQLFPKLKKRKITGQIMWKNGKVEPKARAEFYGRREGFTRADWGGWLQVDAKGNFTFEGFEETEYLIKAWFEKPIDSNSSQVTHSSKCFVIPKKGATKPIKLILEIGGSNCSEKEFQGK